MLIITGSGLLARIRWSAYISKSQSILVVSFSRTDSGLHICYLVVWSNFSFFHNSQWITFLTQLCLDLHSFCPSLLHSLMMWLIVLSLSLHNQHLLFCCKLLIFALISSSSSCHAASTDLPDPLLPCVSIVHHSQEVFQATFWFSTELLYIGSSWSPYLCPSMYRGPQEYITYFSSSVLHVWFA